MIYYYIVTNIHGNDILQMWHVSLRPRFSTFQTIFKETCKNFGPTLNLMLVAKNISYGKELS